jgi:hypothetical protein
MIPLALLNGINCMKLHLLGEDWKLTQESFREVQRICESKRGIVCVQRVHPKNDISQSTSEPLPPMFFGLDIF